MRPSPWADILAFLTKPDWPTAAFWLLLLASLGIAGAAWRRMPPHRPAASLSLCALRIITGAMWWEQSLWKIPPNEDGLIYWMKQMVDHAAIPAQSSFVAGIVLPHIVVFGPLVYLIEVAIGVSLMLGLASRLGALAGLAMTLNLWLGLYSAPGEWPWTYGFLIIIQALFVLDPPGRVLGADSLLRSRSRPLLTLCS